MPHPLPRPPPRPRAAGCRTPGLPAEGGAPAPPPSGARRLRAAAPRPARRRPDRSWAPAPARASSVSWRAWRAIYRMFGRAMTAAPAPTPRSDHGTAVTAGLLGWTLGAFDFFLVGMWLMAMA